MPAIAMLLDEIGNALAVSIELIAFAGFAPGHAGLDWVDDLANTNGLCCARDALEQTLGTGAVGSMGRSQGNP